MSAKPIAVLGMAVNYSDASTPGQLWDLALHRDLAFRAFHPSRLNVETYSTTPFPNDNLTGLPAGILDHWSFNHTRHRIPPIMVQAADTTHWLALDTATDLIAGLPTEWHLNRETTGVVLGNSLTGEVSRAMSLRHRFPTVRAALLAAAHSVDQPVDDELLNRFEDLFRGAFSEPGTESLAGALSNTIAGRIANHLDLHGLAYTVDGACASSLLSVITGCDLLASNRLDTVIVGGVDISLDPFELVGFSRLGALSTTQQMRIYDAYPTGFLPGEGCGMLALARLSDALSAGIDPIAVIRGSGMSTDGAGGLTRPRATGHELALQRAYRQANIDPAHVGLFEGHGTGTAVGDPIEIEAFTAVRAHAEKPAALGSIKANIGHTKAAAGAAGLIKAINAVSQGVVPGTTGTVTPHASLSGNRAVTVLDEPREWVGERIAGVSALGFGGINTHVVVSGPPSPKPPRRLPVTASLGSIDVLLLTADTWQALHHLRQEVLDALATASDRGALQMIRGLPHDLDAHIRFAVAVNSRKSIFEALADLSDAEPSSALTRCGQGWIGVGQPATVGLLFPGQAAPLPPRQRIELARTLQSPWAEVARQAFTELPDLRGNDTALAQPWIVATSCLGLAILDDLGVEPVTAVGHSLGEYVALAWAGTLDSAHLIQLICERGRLMAQLGHADSGMVSVTAPAEKIRSTLAGTDISKVSVAAINTPAHTVIAGDNDALEQVVELLKAPHHRLDISHGFHSPAMAEVTEPWRAVLDGITLRSPQRAYHSTITGSRMSPSSRVNKENLVEQLVEPVEFAAVVPLLEQDCDLLVEVGSGTMMRDLVRAQSPVPIVSMRLDCPGRDLADTVAALAASGAANSIEPWLTLRPRAHTRLTQQTWITNPAAQLELDAGAVPPPRPPRPAPEPSAPEPPTIAGDPPRVVRQLTAELCGLEPADIFDHLSLAADLHLNSLQVGQLLRTAITQCHRHSPADPLSATNATVAELVALIHQLPPAQAEDDEHPASTSRFPWTRRFYDEWVPLEPEQTTANYRLIDARSSRLDQAAAEIASIDLEIDLLCVIHDGAGVGMARSWAAEAQRPGKIIAIDLRDDHEIPTQVPDLPGSFVDLRLDTSGWSKRTVNLLPSPEEIAPAVPVTGGVLLVTGGVDGITAECAVAFATHTKCRLVLTGRRPAEAVQTVLQRLRARGVTADYIQCDVFDPTAVRELYTQCLPTMIIHGAGINVPQNRRNMTAVSLEQAMAPKANGFTHLTTLHPDLSRLNMVVTFGSIIGRCGLEGEYEYAAANCALRELTERFAAEYPAIRTRHLEWTLWSGTGMGESLGVIDHLRRQGVAPLPPHDAIRLFSEALQTAQPVTQLLTGCFPSRDTLPWGIERSRLGRYIDSVITDCADVDLVAECTISPDTDTALRDHVLDGVPILPGVCSLEALAQAWHATTQHDVGSFTDIHLNAPITASPQTTTDLRVAVLAPPNVNAEGVGAGRVTVSSDGHRTPMVTANISSSSTPFGATPTAHETSQWQSTEGLYSRLFFHGGAFECVREFAELTASHVIAHIQATPTEWFSPFFSQDVRLGAPGVLDATIHALQLCYPFSQLLPTGAEALQVYLPVKDGMIYELQARETTVELGEVSCSFDVDLLDPNGQLVLAWQNLKLQKSGELPISTADQLLAPHVARRVREVANARIDAIITPAGQPSTDAAHLLSGYAGSLDSTWGHAPNGRLISSHGYASTSVLIEHRLTVWSPEHAIGVDLVAAGGPPGVLSASDHHTACELATPWAQHGVWAAREAALKAGGCGSLRVHSQEPQEAILTSDRGSALIFSPADDSRIAAVFLEGWKP